MPLTHLERLNMAFGRKKEKEEPKEKVEAPTSEVERLNAFWPCHLNWTKTLIQKTPDTDG